MSVAFNFGPAGAPLARIIATFFAARSARPASPVRAMSMSTSLPYGTWRGQEGALDITSAQNSKVKFMRCVSPFSRTSGASLSVAFSCAAAWLVGVALSSVGDLSSCTAAGVDLPDLVHATAGAKSASHRRTPVRKLAWCMNSKCTFSPARAANAIPEKLCRRTRRIRHAALAHWKQQ